MWNTGEQCEICEHALNTTQKETYRNVNFTKAILMITSFETSHSLALTSCVVTLNKSYSHLKDHRYSEITGYSFSGGHLMLSIKPV